jgi:hypothetical protein
MLTGALTDVLPDPTASVIAAVGTCQIEAAPLNLLMTDLPMDTSRELFHFTDGALADAGYHFHEQSNPLHTHSFVEIAFATGGEGVHHSLAGRQQLSRGDVILLRPGVWHGYDNCRNLELYNCCFSSELLRHELAWTREDPLLGYLLWTGPYHLPGAVRRPRGVPATSAGRDCLHRSGLRGARQVTRPGSAPGSAAVQYPSGGRLGLACWTLAARS